MYDHSGKGTYLTSLLTPKVIQLPYLAGGACKKRILRKLMIDYVIFPKRSHANCSLDTRFIQSTYFPKKTQAAEKTLIKSKVATNCQNSLSAATVSYCKSIFSRPGR